MKILLGPDICRYIMKQQPQNLLNQLQSWSESNSELMLSAITYAELVAGVLLTEDRQKHMDLVQGFCERLDDIEPWDMAAVDCYRDLQIAAMSQQTTLNMNDAMLAAHVISLEAELLTLSSSAFKNIDGLHLHVWRKEDC